MNVSAYYNISTFDNNTKVIHKSNNITLGENVDKEKFIAVYQKAVESGCPMAMTGLGQYYENVEKN